jgi:hypothetical protein
MEIKDLEIIDGEKVISLKENPLLNEHAVIRPGNERLETLKRVSYIESLIEENFDENEIHESLISEYGITRHEAKKLYKKALFNLYNTNDKKIKRKIHLYKLENLLDKTEEGEDWELYRKTLKDIATLDALDAPTKFHLGNDPDSPLTIVKTIPDDLLPEKYRD